MDKDKRNYERIDDLNNQESIESITSALLFNNIEFDVSNTSSVSGLNVTNVVRVKVKKTDIIVNKRASFTIYGISFSRPNVFDQVHRYTFPSKTNEALIKFILKYLPENHPDIPENIHVEIERGEIYISLVFEI